MPDIPSETQEIEVESASTLDTMNRLLDGDDKGQDKGKDVEKAKPEPKPKPVETKKETPPEIEIEAEQKPAKEEEEEEEKEEEQEEGELTEEEQEEEELRASEGPQIVSELKQKYPDIFKEFKPLRNILFRENQFSQIFMDPHDAAEHVQLLEDYKEFERELVGGDTGRVIKAIKDTDERGYKHFLSNLLPTLYETDRQSYADMTFPIIAGILGRARATGEARGDENLTRSVKHISALIWPELKGEVPKIPTKRRDEDDPELNRRKQEIEEREQLLDRKESSRFIGSVKVSCDGLLKRTVEKGIDPDNSLSSFLKSSIVEKTINDVRELMDEDTQFGRAMARLFDRAKRAGYADEFRTRMIGTFLGRAKQLIGPIRRRYINQALGTVSNDKDKEDKPPIRKAVGSGSASSNVKTVKSSEVDWARTTDLDILNRKPTLKRKG